MLAHPLERGPGGGDRAEGVGPVELARQRLARALGGDPQRVGVAEPGLLGGELDVLARLRVDLADLLEAEPQQVGLAGAVTGVGRDVVELALGGAQLVVEGAVAGEQVADGGAGEPVERGELGRRTEQPVLVGLAVHRHQRLGEVGQPADRQRGAAGEGPRAPLGADRAAEHDPVVLDLSPDLVDLGRHLRQPLEPYGPLDPGRPRPGADRAAVGPAAQEQPEGGDDHGLAGTGLTGDDGQPRPQLQRRGVDHPELLDADLLKHRRPRWVGVARPGRATPRPTARTWPPAGR